METTLISTIYSLEPVMACITHFTPKKLILLREEDSPAKKLEAERMLKETVGRVMEVEPHLTSIYDVVQIARDTADAIEKEAAQGRKIIINISGGRKPQALGALFGCYSRHEEVERIVYVTQEDQEIIDLPILNFGISSTKRLILEELEEGETSVKKLAVKVGISRGMTYNHIRELRDMGFIHHNHLEITSAGKLAII
ncbi:MAG TPA: CRISPR-associated CARF protein Csa3 [Methanobacterium sp.]|nr:CRISPR-associated CARF protein Csa3 [Methanobacterium sp.]